MPNVECRVVDTATGADLGTGEPGEILLRGPIVMQGYLNEPAATAATIDVEGWLRTGDIGYADGDFFIVDRTKELIKYKGLQVAPAELEAVILGHAAVADAAVVGAADEEAGEVPKAYVVRKGQITAEEIMIYVAARVAPHKKIGLSSSSTSCRSRRRVSCCVGCCSSGNAPDLPPKSAAVHLLRRWLSGLLISHPDKTTGRPRSRPLTARIVW
jgi:acyl-CoA synthetase (AMP-forming)/AMP-acid ligase II